MIGFRKYGSYYLFFFSPGDSLGKNEGRGMNFRYVIVFHGQSCFSPRTTTFALVKRHSNHSFVCVSLSLSGFSYARFATNVPATDTRRRT